ncbi:MerR family transcriptional regulator [Bauldia sp.]|uniref:MerR family transcriptional regulator n=1 Tax=Bauldia sp. TaxID=2575872 RepID=UPI003BA88328
MAKSPDAFRTISEVADDLDLPQHVLRFWETRFSQIKPMKRGGGRRYYRPDDVDLLRGIKLLLYGEGYTIRGVQRILREQSPRAVIEAGRQGEAGGISGGGQAEAGDDREPAAKPEPRAKVRGRSRKTKRQPEAMPSPDEGPESAGLSSADIEQLNAALTELLECKRLLDQAR